ncbi:MAG TPA: SCO family protein [Dongiaceae bacterium]|jgi:protein SCO1/2|nr:SCO family protein [Dongiaceae bacterium]
MSAEEPAPRLPPTRRRALQALAAAAAIAAGAGGSLHFLWPRAEGTNVKIGGPFRLKSQDGGTVDSARLTGKPYAVFFGFTHCPEVCPTTLSDLAQAFAAIPDLPADFRVYFISVDPERDTPEVLKEYTSNFDPRIVGLWASPAELPKVAKEFAVYYEKIPTSDGSYTMNHTAVVFLMDRHNKFRSVINYDDPVDTYVRKLKELIAAE